MIPLSDSPMSMFDSTTWSILEQIDSPRVIAVEPRPTDSTPISGGVPANPLERIVQIIRSNAELYERLDRLVERIAGVRRYLARSDCNALLARAELARLKSNYSAVLTRLRANRVEARGLLGLYPEGRADSITPRFTPGIGLANT
jgi:hypothetical protein